MTCRFLPTVTTGLLLCTGTAWAQPVLKNMERFAPGHKMTYLKLQDANIATGKGGANQKWNYFFINPTGADTVVKTIVAAAGRPESTGAPKANLLEVDKETTVVTGQDENTGQVWAVQRGGLDMNYSVPYMFVKRPMKYMDSIVSYPVRSYKSFGGAHGAGTSKTIADGWGKLVLPSGVYDVLRVRFEQHFKDTATGNGAVTQTDVVSYAWFDAIHKGALFKVDEVTITSPYFNKVIKDAMVLLKEED